MPTTRPTTSANRLIGWNTLIKPPPNCCRVSITSAFLFDTHQPHEQKGNLRKWIHAERQRYIHNLHEHEHEREAADEAGDKDDADAPVAADPHEGGEIDERAKKKPQLIDQARVGNRHGDTDPQQVWIGFFLLRRDGKLD